MNICSPYIFTLKVRRQRRGKMSAHFVNGNKSKLKSIQLIQSRGLFTFILKGYITNIPLVPEKKPKGSV